MRSSGAWGSGTRGAQFGGEAAAVQDGGEGAAERRGSPALKPEYGSQPYDSNYILAWALQTLPGAVALSTERQEHTGSIRLVAALLFVMGQR